MVTNPTPRQQSMGLCQPCTDTFWRAMGFACRKEPMPMDPPPRLVTCPTCMGGWLGRWLAMERLRAEATGAVEATEVEPLEMGAPPAAPMDDDTSLLWGF